MLNALKIATCAALLMVPPAAAQTDGVDIDAAVAAAREAIEVPGFSGSVVVMHNGETVLTQARGMADQTSGRVNTTETRFNIASVGKFLTAIGMVRAADQAGIDDFASISPGDILREDADLFTEELTLGDIMAHGTDIESFFTTETAEAQAMDAEGNADFFDLVRLAQDGPVGRNLEGLAYNNSNAIVTGEMLARLNGTSYEDAMQALVFEPASVDSPRFTRLSQAETLDLALPYVPEGFVMENMRRSRPGDVLPTHYPQQARTPLNEVVSMAAGGLYSSAPDLAKIAMETLGGDLLTDAQLGTMCASRVSMRGMIFGMGCGGREFGENRVRWGHNGGAPGVSAQLAIYPHQDLVIVVLSNHQSRATPVLNAFETALFGPEEDAQSQGGLVIRN